MKRRTKARLAYLHLGLGRFLRSLGWPEGAVAAYRDAVTANPLWAEAYLDLGETLLDMEQWAESADALRKAVRLQPDHQEARANLAVALARNGKSRESLDSLEALARLRPQDPEVYLLIGSLQRRAQRYDEAVRAFRWAVRLPRSPRHLRCRLGEVILGDESWRRLLVAYEGAAALTPRGAAATAPPWHSTLNHHPVETPREFRRVAPGPASPAAQRTALVVRWQYARALLRRARRGFSLLWSVVSGLPQVFRRRPASSVRIFPARSTGRPAPSVRTPRRADGSRH